jgi:hypothetical protein
MKGELRAEGTIRDLKKIEGHPVDVELREPSPAFAAALIAKGASVEPAKTTLYRVQAPGTPDAVAAMVLQTARESGAQVRGFSLAQRSLEEAFLEVLRA